MCECVTETCPIKPIINFPYSHTFNSAGLYCFSLNPSSFMRECMLLFQNKSSKIHKSLFITVDYHIKNNFLPFLISCCHLRIKIGWHGPFYCIGILEHLALYWCNFDIITKFILWAVYSRHHNFNDICCVLCCNYRAILFLNRERKSYVERSLINTKKTRTSALRVSIEFYKGIQYASAFNKWKFSNLPFSFNYNG